uniref:Uncharacterized protein n=1 Tax=Octopus bimaculoides TaxID=37653 RepID=A0A0L8G264_OCTBM
MNVPKSRMYAKEVNAKTLLAVSSVNVILDMPWILLSTRALTLMNVL